MKKTIILLFVILMANVAFAITVDGHAFLENQTNHSSIGVFFERTAPSYLTYTVYTNASGYYTVNIETGIYDISYTKYDYFSEWLIDLSLFSNTSLSDITLMEHTTLLNVPAVFPTIQNAIEYALYADTVLVAPGVYYENINFVGKNITVASLFLTTQDTSFISQTIIDGGMNDSVVEIKSGEGQNAVLCGFTIQNGYAHGSSPYDYNGGGIYCYSSCPTISNLIIKNNMATGYGGGIGCDWGSSPSLMELTIRNNSASNSGGGIFISYPGSCLSNVIISNNFAGSKSGGVYFYGGNSTLDRVDIINNSCNGNGGGIYCDYSATINLTNTIVSNNFGNYGIYIFSGNASITYSNFYDNQNGNFFNCDPWVGINVAVNANEDSCDVYNNIQLDPQFVNISNENYHLNESSPCIDAGDPTSSLDPDGTVVDIGTLYFDQTLNFPNADFNSNINSGYVQLIVNFIDLSTPGILGNPIIEWNWDFNNDGTIDSEAQNPLFTYTEAGTYSVSLTVSDGTNEDTMIKEDYITVLEPIGADFEGNPLNGNTPLEVNFTDLSSGDPTSWLWDFDNDGLVDSNEQNPIYLYDDVGVYTVSLTVSDGNSEDTKIKENYITVNSVSGDNNLLPVTTRLFSNHPNPFNPITTISFEIKEGETGILTIFNLRGQLIESNEFNSGNHDYIWNADKHGSGLYFYQLKTESCVETKKMLLLK